MGLKDKLGKVGKKATHNIESAADVAKGSANQMKSTAGSTLDKATNTVDGAVKKTAAGIDNITTDVKTNIKPKKVGKNNSLFKRKQSNTPAGKSAKADNNRLKLSIGLLSLLLLGLLGYAASLFLNKDTSTNDVTKPPAVTPNKQDVVPPPQPTSVQDETASLEGSSDASSDTVNNSENTSNAVDTAATANEEKLPETITEPIPTDQTVAAEELDQLQDERDQMTEQEQLIQEQLEALEQMEKLKAERIAILEKSLAQKAASN